MKDIVMYALCGAVGGISGFYDWGWVITKDGKTRFNPRGALFNIVAIILIVGVFKHL